MKKFDNFSKDFRHMPAVTRTQMFETFDQWCDNVTLGVWTPQKMVQALSMAAHRHEGAQMWVTKQVSHDLMRSDIPEPDFESLVWPAQSLEFVFEDPQLPTFILRNVAPATLREYSRSIADDITAVKPSRQAADEGLIYYDSRVLASVFLKTPKNSLLSSCMTIEELNKFARGEAQDSDGKFCMEDELVGSAADTSHDDPLRDLMLLAYKILLFAGTPRFAPRVEKNLFPRKMGGKPGFMNRPKLTRYIVEYLPKQIAEKKAEAAKLGESHSFRGRRGHFRTYTAERYVNKRGDRDYMWPIPNPHGDDVKRKFIVRKP